MKFQKLTSLLIAAGLLSLTAFATQAAESEYSFKVNNKTKVAIKKILVSEDGKTWGFFDIGKGIPAGGSETLVWDTSTNNSGCKQFVKAVYADDTEAEAAKFDFCEKGLDLEFE
jgi:hypothetical protein